MAKRKKPKKPGGGPRSPEAGADPASTKAHHSPAGLTAGGVFYFWAKVVMLILLNHPRPIAIAAKA